MRIIFVSVLAVLFMLAGICKAEDAVTKTSADLKEKHVLVDRDNDGTIDGVDVYNVDGKIIRQGYDSDKDNVMERWQSYDPNTGLPNVVASDAYGELN